MALRPVMSSGSRQSGAVVGGFVRTTREPKPSGRASTINFAVDDNAYDASRPAMVGAGNALVHPRPTETFPGRPKVAKLPAPPSEMPTLVAARPGFRAPPWSDSLRS